MFFHLTPGFDFKRERGGARWSQTFGGDCSLRQGVLCTVISAAQLMYVSSMEWPSINILSSHSLICLIVLHGSNMGRPRWKVTLNSNFAVERNDPPKGSPKWKRECSHQGQVRIPQHPQEECRDAECLGWTEPFASRMVSQRGPCSSSHSCGWICCYRTKRLRRCNWGCRT